jgi:4,4'-diaponeurosporenoate glycosyltransferase
MAYFLIVFLWLLGFSFLWRIQRINTPALPAVPAAPVSIIIPARNEQDNLKRLLGSLQGQLRTDDEVVVVDDHSLDATAKVARQYGARVISSAELPAGWVGKTWACWQGVQNARGEFLIFLDADTFLEPAGLTRILASFSEEGHFLSIQPYHKMRKPYEQLSAYFNVIALAGSNAFTVLGSRVKPRGGFGPCLACRKNHYFQVGGHRAVRGQILENLALGHEIRKAGLEIRCFGGKGVLSFRMYPQGFKSLLEGFIKGFALGSRAISPASLILISAWVTGGMGVTRHLLQAFIAQDPAGVAPWLLLDLMYAGQLCGMLFRIGNFSWFTGLFFQIPLLFFIVLFAVSSLKTFFFKKVTWKGREITSD